MAKPAQNNPAIDLIRALTKGPKGQVEVRAIPNKRGTGEIIRKWVTTPTEIDAFASRFDKHSGYGVYFGVVKRNGGGKKQHCTEAAALWADIDTVTMGWDTDECLKAIYNLPDALMPNAVVTSGGGIHVYYYLAHLHTHDEIEEANRKVRDFFGGDNCWNIDRVMRLPGTWNTKRGIGAAKRCEVLFNYANVRRDLDVLLTAIADTGETLHNGKFVPVSDVPTEPVVTPATLDNTKTYQSIVMGRNVSKSLETMWSHRVRYHAPRGYMGINEAALITTARLHCAGQKDDAIVNITLSYIRERKAQDAPGEVWNRETELPAVQTMLERWKPRWSTLKKEVKKDAKSERV